MEIERLIESVAEGMYALIEPGKDWKDAIADDPELVSELRFRARICVKGSRITGDPPTGLDLRFKRAFVGDV